MFLSLLLLLLLLFTVCAFGFCFRTLPVFFILFFSRAVKRKTAKQKRKGYKNGKRVALTHAGLQGYSCTQAVLLLHTCRATLAHTHTHAGLLLHTRGYSCTHTLGATPAHTQGYSCTHEGLLLHTHRATPAHRQGYSCSGMKSTLPLGRTPFCWRLVLVPTARSTLPADSIGTSAEPDKCCIQCVVTIS